MIKIEAGKKYIVRPTREKIMEDRICECVKASKLEYIFSYEKIMFKVEKMKYRLAVTSVDGKDYEPISVHILEIENNETPKQLEMEIPTNSDTVNYNEVMNGIEKYFNLFIITKGNNSRKVQLRKLTSHYNLKFKTKFTTMDIKNCLIDNGFISHDGYRTIKIPKILYDEIKAKLEPTNTTDSPKKIVTPKNKDREVKPPVVVKPKERISDSIIKIADEILVIIGIFKKRIFK